MTAPRLAIVVIAVDDVDAASTFWAALTGLSATERVPGVFAEHGAPDGAGPGVAWYRRESYVANLGAEVGDLAAGEVHPAELYLRVDDVAHELERAVALGAAELSPAGARPWGETVAYVRAPGGAVVALATGR